MRRTYSGTRQEFRVFSFRALPHPHPFSLYARKLTLGTHSAAKPQPNLEEPRMHANGHEFENKSRAFAALSM
jgi:hypothetical protein